MNKKTLNIILCRGLPGSGKTTWAKNEVMRHPDTMARVSRDDLRQILFCREVLTGPDKNREENTVTKTQIDAARNILLMGRHVIIDDMNLSANAVERFYALAHEFEGAVQLRFQDFPVSIKECIARDNKRKNEGQRFVGEKVIKDISKRYLHGGSELPTLDVKYYSMVEPFVLEQDESLPPAWIVDIDGTLAHMQTGYGARSPYDWHRVLEDLPDKEVLELVQALHRADYKIILVTGRDMSSKGFTRDWLDVYEAPYDLLFMREFDDNRSDAIIKAEIYEREILGKYFVAGVLDDRKQVVDMWRSKGLKVAQVAPGLF